MASIRKASHAGSWYSKSSNKLSEELDEWLANVPNDVSPINNPNDTVRPPVKGARVIIAPHAGYSYSGPAAAWAYKCLDLSNCKRIFLLGPSHVIYLKDCSLSSHTHYQTPLGDLKLDRATIDELNSTGKFSAWDHDAEEDEHSLEMHLPYLYKRLSEQYASESEFPLLVPILVGSVEPPNRTSRQSSKGPLDETGYGKLLLPYLEDPTSVFVVSSDFCHWGSRFSFQSAMPDEVDRSAMAAIETGSHQAFADDLKSTKNTVCGRHPIGVLMAALEEYRKKHDIKDAKTGVFQFVRYERSSEIKSRRDSSVSYCSAIAVLP